MNVDSGQDHALSNVDGWFARFSPVAGVFPFTTHKAQFIESRRALMSDLLIFDVLLISGGIHHPDMLFPPADSASLRRLLDAIGNSVYDILKKDCLVYILLKWAWDTDPEATNPGWDTRYLRDRCIPPQFAALADAYWLLDTGTQLFKAVSILSDARLNRDYVSKILQALALSCSPASFASGTSPDTAMLIVQYVRTAKPLLTEPDDIDLYALSLAQLSFMDAWAYQRSFPEGNNTRERLLRKIIGWCLMPAPKQEPLAQLLAFPLSSYEHSFLHEFALPSSSSSVNTRATSTPILSSQAISTLQDLLFVRAIQSGDYVYAIKLDRQFSSVSPSLGSGSFPNTAPQARDTIDRKSIIQDLFAALPPAERTLLEDEIGKVATGVRANAFPTPRQGPSGLPRKTRMADSGLSASWEDVGASTASHAPSTSIPLSTSPVGASFASRGTPATASKTDKTSWPTFSMSTSAPPFAPRVPQPSFGLQAPPTPKFTAFGSPIPSTPGPSTAKGATTEQAKTMFSTSTVGAPSAAVKPATRTSLFDTSGSAKNAQNAFYKPSLSPAARTSLDVRNVPESAKDTEQDTISAKQNGKTQGGDDRGEDVSMGSGSDVEIIEVDRRDESGGEEEAATDEDDAGDFLTYDKSGAANFTLGTRHVSEVMDEDSGVGPALAFSVFNRSRNAAQSINGQAASANERVLHASPPRRARVSPVHGEDESLSASTTRAHALPGAFHLEEEEEEDRHGDNEDEGDDEEIGHASLTQSSRRGTRTRRRSATPSRSSTRSQPQGGRKKAATSAGGAANQPSTRRASSRQNLSHSIPGSLMDDDDEPGQDDAERTNTRDEDTEMDEQEEEHDAIGPLPSRSSRRTRSSGASTKSKSSSKAAAPAKATAAKGKAKARPPEVKTPARRSSRLSMASSTSPDHVEAASPTKGRKSTGSRASGSGNVATRGAARRKR